MSGAMGGMPGPLPEGERLLWQGKPDWRLMARHVFHLRLVAAYFGAILAISAISGFHSGTPIGQLAVSTLLMAAAALVPVIVMVLYAWGTQRATTYTITSKRVVIRLGVALSVTINLPFSRIDGASFRPAKDGSGAIALQLAPGNKLAYLILWPHARPWRVKQPEPMLRALPEAAKVAQVLSRALAASAEVSAPVIEVLQGQGQTGTIIASNPGAAAA